MFKSRGVISNKITHTHTHLAPQITRTQKTIVAFVESILPPTFWEILLMVQKPCTSLVYLIIYEGFIHPMLQGNGRKKKNNFHPQRLRLKPRHVCKTNGMKGDGGADRMAFLKLATRWGPRADHYKWSEGHGVPL